MDDKPDYLKDRRARLTDLVLDFAQSIIDDPDAPPKLRAPTPRVSVAAPVLRAASPPAYVDYDNASGLDALTTKALQKAEEILDLPLEMGDKDFATVLRAQQGMVTSLLTTQVRVDEGKLRQKQADIMPRLLDLLEVEQAKLPELRALN